MTHLLIVVSLTAVVVLIVVFYLFRRTQIRPEKFDTNIYIDGLKALLRGQDEQAFASLKETVTADSDNVDAYIQLGNIFRRRKKVQQALRIHRDLTYRQTLTQAEKREILIALYQDFLEANDEASAIRAIKELLDVTPDDRFGLQVLLRTHEKAGEWKDAAVLRKKLDKLGGDDSQKTLALYKIFEGYDLAKQGDRHRARLFFKEAVHYDKSCLAAYLAIGDSYYDESRLEDAIEYWTKVITLKPEEGHLVFERLKKGFFEVGRYGDYAETLASLLQACPEHLSARLELAYFMEKKGDRDAARDHYTTALDNHPESMLAKLGLYRLNRESGKREAADAIYKQIIKMAVKREVGNFRCSSCGLNADNKAWLCLRCKAVDSFESVKP
jgi:lipopolysaccharide biosynthesis regulator YciM